jgi:hypothetical protein
MISAPSAATSTARWSPARDRLVDSIGGLPAGNAFRVRRSHVAGNGPPERSHRSLPVQAARVDSASCSTPATPGIGSNLQQLIYGVIVLLVIALNARRSHD